MELIKQIKEAEKEAVEIVDKAKANALKLNEVARTERAEKLAEAQQKRHEAIDAAIESARQTGMEQVLQLKDQGQSQVDSLIQSTQAKKPQCIDKVVEQLKNL